MREPYTCNHPDHSVKKTKRINAGRNPMIAFQCGHCGRLVGKWIPLARAPGWESLPEWDYGIEPLWEASEAEYAKEYRSRKIEDQGVSAFAKRGTEPNEKFWDKYSEYLKSDAWREKRALVLKRANGICEGCALSDATQVHHLSYERVGKEMLFDLVAICDSCHDSIHHAKDAA